MASSAKACLMVLGGWRDADGVKGWERAGLMSPWLCVCLSLRDDTPSPRAACHSPRRSTSRALDERGIQNCGCGSARCPNQAIEPPELVSMSASVAWGVGRSKVGASSLAATETHNVVGSRALICRHGCPHPSSKRRSRQRPSAGFTECGPADGTGAVGAPDSGHRSKRASDVPGIIGCLPT